MLLGLILAGSNNHITFQTLIEPTFEGMERLDLHYFSFQIYIFSALYNLITNELFSYIYSIF